MKPYQDHDPILDQGKAIPHPKKPTPGKKLAKYKIMREVMAFGAAVLGGAGMRRR